MNKLFLFDFDGTITNKDTLFDFLKLSFPKQYCSNFIKFIPLFILTKLKLANTENAKKKFIASFLKGKNKSEIEILSYKYFEHQKDIILRPKALEYIKSISEEADKYMVTASLDLWTKPFSDYLGLTLISTKAEFINDIFTGNFSSANCNYKEKVIRIINEIELSNFNEVYAFGDTKGDKYMLNLSTHPHFKYFE